MHDDGRRQERPFEDSEDNQNSRTCLCMGMHCEYDSMVYCLISSCFSKNNYGVLYFIYKKNL